MTDISNWQDLQDAIKYALIDATDGSTQIVTGVSGSRIVVMDYTLVASADAQITWMSDTGEALSGPMDLYCTPTVSVASLSRSASALLHPGFSPAGHFRSDTGEGVSLVVSGGDVNGHLSYIEGAV